MCCPAPTLVHQTPLHKASLQGHLEVARTLLDQGAKIDCTDAEDDTPMTLASFRGHTDIVRLLLERDTDEEGYCYRQAWHRNLDGMAASHHAAWKGHKAVLEELVESGGLDVLYPTVSGRTLIHVAAGYGQLELVGYLLSEMHLDANQTCAVQQVSKSKAAAAAAAAAVAAQQQGAAAQRPQQVAAAGGGGGAAAAGAASNKGGQQQKKDFKYRWLRTKAKGLQITDELTVTSIGDGDGCAVMRLPAHKQLIYVELKINVIDEFSRSNVSIGLGKASIKQQDMPGLVAETIGYSGSNGYCYRGSKSERKQYGPKFGHNDVIGVM